VRVRIRSRSTSVKPPSTAIISRLVLVPVSAHGSASERNCALASTLLHDGTHIEGRACEAIDARNRHHVAGGEVAEHFQKLAPVAVCAGHLLAVNLGAARAAKPLKLGTERLAGRC
jgi:hypothetical protein